jgi:phage shock protein PspC (stress-responsive transcriptional regulator)
METHDPQPDSQEQLDALRASGKLSEEEYETLRDALERREAPPQLVPLPRPRLRKSWRNRQLGGVCGGIANFLDINAWLIRILALVFAFSSCGLALLVYLILYIALPWDEEDADLVWHFPWGYALAILAFCIALLFGMRWMNGQAARVFADFEAELPSLTRWVLSAFRYWPLLIVGAILAAIVDGLLPQRSTARTVFRVVTLCGLVGLVAVYVFAIWLPISSL